MKIKIKFKALTYNGKVIVFTKDFYCPDFEVIPPKKLNDGELPEITVESQIIDWLDEQDKSNLMIEKDLGVIIDYWIPKKKEKKSTIVDYLKKANLSEQLMLDLLAVYKKIKPIIKGKSVEYQIHMMLSHLSIGYDAAANAYKHISNILQVENIKDAEKLLKITKKVLK